MGLTEAMQSKEIKKLPIEVLTTQLSALFDRAALAVSQGDSQADHLEVLDSILTALAQTQPPK